MVGREVGVEDTHAPALERQHAARFAVSDDLPTPPLPETTATIARTAAAARAEPRVLLADLLLDVRAAVAGDVLVALGTGVTRSPSWSALHAATATKSSATT